MPTYEYECKSCGHSFEVFQPMSEEPLKTCAMCGKEVRRLIFGGAGVIFKGSGFYVTDKTADKGKKAAPAQKTADASGTTQSPPAAPAKDSAAGGTNGGVTKPAAQTT